MADLTFSDVRLCGQVEALATAANGHLLGLRVARRDGSYGVVQVSVPPDMHPPIGAYLRVFGELADNGVVLVAPGHGKAEVLTLPGSAPAAAGAPPPVQPAPPVKAAPPPPPSKSMGAAPSAAMAARPGGSVPRFGRAFGRPASPVPAPVTTAPAPPAAPALSASSAPPAPPAVRAEGTSSPSGTLAAAKLEPAPRADVRPVVRRSSLGRGEDSAGEQPVPATLPPVQAAAVMPKQGKLLPNNPDDVDLEIPW